MNYKKSVRSLEIDLLLNEEWMHVTENEKDKKIQKKKISQIKKKKVQWNSKLIYIERYFICPLSSDMEIKI